MPNKIVFARRSQILLSLVFFLIGQSVRAFQSSFGGTWQSTLMRERTRTTSLVKDNQRISSTGCAATRARESDQAEETSFLMKGFSTASGEIVNPYKVLKVSRDASRIEIRKAYRKVSKRYHPDMVRHKEILPGNCNNQDDVESEWERIQISYNILSEKKTRMQYDRHEVIANPGAALQRAVMGAAVAGIVGIGTSIFHVGSLTLGHMIGEDRETNSS